MICSYCETENQETEVCSFCGADLQAVRPEPKHYLSEEDSHLPQPELKRFHTLDLCLLMRFLRKERSDAYRLMQTVRKAPESVSVPADSIAFAEQLYRESTARMKVIENILIDRLGYKPKRIDDKMIASLQVKMGNSFR